VVNIEVAECTMTALAISKITQQVQVSKTILLVEDEEFVREMIYKTLEAAGYRVLNCGNAKQAQAVYRQYGEVIDLLLTDVVLPAQSGIDLAKDLLALNADLKVVLISGYPEKLVAETGLREHRMFYLSKPFSSESLLRKLRQVIGSIPDGIAV
jgi:two-component system, cell cycle sensor histidine kinase and response regulator CckA